MIGRKIPNAKYPGRGKKVTVDGDQKAAAAEIDGDQKSEVDKNNLSVIEFYYKKSIRVIRQERRAKRARKRRNGWMFGRKIKVDLQLYPMYDVPSVIKTTEAEKVLIRDAEGREETYYCHHCPWPRREKPRVDKDYDPSYDDVFKFFGDINDYDISEVVFTLGNEPGSIPMTEKLSFIPPPGSNVPELTKKKKNEKEKKKEKEKEKKKEKKREKEMKRWKQSGQLLGHLHEFDSFHQRSSVCVA